MSSISSVTAPDLYQLLQQTTDNQSQTAAANGSALPIASVDGSTSETQAAPAHHHHHHGGGGKLQSQIESAVTSALQNSNGSTDPNQIIQNAIATVLQANGSGQTNSTSASQTGGTITVAPPSSDPSATVTDAQQQQFNQLLQSYGVNPQQFQADFKAAFQNTQGNNAPDFPTMFSSFPPGSAIDTNA